MVNKILLYATVSKPPSVFGTDAFDEVEELEFEIEIENTFFYHGKPFFRKSHICVLITGKWQIQRILTDSSKFLSGSRVYLEGELGSCTVETEGDTNCILVRSFGCFKARYTPPNVVSPTEPKKLEKPRKDAESKPLVNFELTEDGGDPPF